MILLTFAFAPLLLLLSILLVSEYRIAIDSARNDVRRLAEIAATQQSNLFSNARVLLETLRQMPEVTSTGGPDCAAMLMRVKQANPQYHTIGVVGADEMVTCHSKLRVAQKVGAPDVFAAMIRPEAPEFNVGEFIIGKVSGQPTVIASLKLFDGSGAVSGTVFASMNLEALSASARAISDEGRRSVVMIETATGRLLTRYPPLPVPFGTSYEGHPLVDAMAATSGIGNAELSGLDGVERIYGLATLSGTGDENIMIGVGLPRDVVLAVVYSHVALSVVACIVLLAVAFGGTWWLGYWTQLRPIGRLKRIAERIGAGQLDARSTLESWQAPELRSLGHAIDSMAEKLEEGRRAEEAIASSEARYRLLAENTADLVTSLDASGRRVFVSPASRDLLGMEPEELFAGRPQDIAHPDDLPIVESMMGDLASGIAVSGVQYRVRHRDGHAVWVEVGGRPMEGGQGTVLAIRDISERKLAEQHLAAANQRLAGLASTDGLTGLGNRRSFDERLKAEFDRSVAERADLSLVLIDVDWFKRFNDTYGHLAGDECLRLIASTIGGAARNPSDHAARFGGEELALVLPDTSVGDAIERAEAVRQAVEAMNLAHTGSEFGHVTISIGVVSIHGGWGFSSPDDMLRSADQALYEVKANGRNALRYAMSLAVKGENRIGKLGAA